MFELNFAPSILYMQIIAHVIDFHIFASNNTRFINRPLTNGLTIDFAAKV
jgi:hypothetical protein